MSTLRLKWSSIGFPAGGTADGGGIQRLTDRALAACRRKKASTSGGGLDGGARFILGSTGMLLITSAIGATRAENPALFHTLSRQREPKDHLSLKSASSSSASAASSREAQCGTGWVAQSPFRTLIQCRRRCWPY